MDEYLRRGSEVHVDAVRYAFLSAYGPGEFTHSDANEGAAKVFDGWVRNLQSEAWDEGARWGAVEFQSLGGQIRDESQVNLVAGENPYRKETK